MTTLGAALVPSEHTSLRVYQDSLLYFVGSLQVIIPIPMVRQWERALLPCT